MLFCALHVLPCTEFQGPKTHFVLNLTVVNLCRRRQEEGRQAACSGSEEGQELGVASTQSAKRKAEGAKEAGWEAGERLMSRSTGRVCRV